MKPSLVIMAAGIGSRYGGLKQMESMGPSGAVLLDYSVYDALQAGFGKVIFVIRHDIEDDFKRLVGRKWESKAPVRYVFQELGMLPEGFKAPEGRQKPWGTAHAVWVAQGATEEPFAAINADDYYGRKSLRILADFLKKIRRNDAATYAMVGFPLSKTLSEHGTVTRGVCRVGRGGQLKDVAERGQVGREGRKFFYVDESGVKRFLKGNQTVSMNLWGFTPHFFKQIEENFLNFLKAADNDLKAEFLLPRLVDHLVTHKQAKVKVLPTKDQWFGVTYPQDRENVRKIMEDWAEKKIYPPFVP